MPMSLEDAKAAVKAVNSFDALSKNFSAHSDYHFYETSARARVAFGGPATVCGFYVKKKSTTTYTHKTTNETLDHPKRKWKRTQYSTGSRTDKISLDGSSPIARGKSANDIVNNVLTPAFGDYTNGEYKEDAADPNNVFHYIYPLPDGYGGTTVTRVGNEYDCTHVDVVIRKNGVNASIVTHYPCAVGWFGGMTDLT